MDRVCEGAVVTSTLDAAYRYAVHGWHVFPTVPNKRVPMIEKWPQRATTDLVQIEQWWTKQFPSAGIGIATGTKSGVWVLDIDMKDGKDGLESLAKLEAKHGQLPPTLTAKTPSGGYHLFFAMPLGMSIRNDQNGSVGRGLDVRGDGGFVVAAPTTIEGRAYEWLTGPLTR